MLIQRQKVLVVEDDYLQRFAISELIANDGIDVVECENAEAAAEAIDQFALEIVLLITDVNLGPGMSGTDLVPLARRKIPGIFIVVVSGKKAPALAPDIVFFPKPVPLDELRDLVLRTTLVH